MRATGKQDSNMEGVSTSGRMGLSFRVISGWTSEKVRGSSSTPITLAWKAIGGMI